MTWLTKTKPYFYRLSFRIFFVFWIYSTLMVSLAIFIPYLDQRRIHTLSKEEYGQNIERVNRLLQAPKRHRDMVMRRFIVVPIKDLDQQNTAIEGINDDSYQSFIYSTITRKYAYKQNIGNRQIIGPFVDNNYAFYVLAHRSAQGEYLTRLFDSPISLIGLMMLFGLPFVILLTLSLYKPIQRLKMAAERVAQGDWTIDKKLEEGTIEFSTLGASFNHMIEALTSAEAEKDRLFANLSHELRTPLTRIRLTNSLIRRKTDEYEKEVSRIESNLVLIEERIQSMLSLSRQKILSRDHLEVIALDSALLQLLAEAEFEAEANHKTLTYGDIPQVKIHLNLELFQSGLENILRNAIHYAKSHIEVILEVHHNTLTINISDDGPGVNAADLEHLFEAFYRGERPEEIADSNGAGLGLAIAEQMTKSHKGSIHAHNADPHGLAITITLPLTQEQP